MKDKQLRVAVKELCNTLGISFYINFTNEIEVDKFNNLDGGDRDKRPATRKDVYESSIELLERIISLEKYLKVEYIKEDGRKHKKLTKQNNGNTR